MKAIDSDLIIEVTRWGSPLDDNKTFHGYVFEDSENHTKGSFGTRWAKSHFKPYKINTATLTNDNPNKVEVYDKDVNLRLKCLKLAVASNVTDPQVLAQEFYDWITTNQ